MSACLWSMCNIIAMFYKSCKVVPIFPPSRSKQNTLTCLSVSLFHIVINVIFDIMQFPCCWNDWSDQQNKRTEILQ